MKESEKQEIMKKIETKVDAIEKATSQPVSEKKFEDIIMQECLFYLNYQLEQGIIDTNEKQRVMKQLFQNMSKEFTQNELDNISPPAKGEFLIRFCLPKNIRDNVLGCLEEDYHVNFKRVGKDYAVILYYKEVFLSIWPMLYTKLKQLGAITFLEEFIRRVLL